MSNRLLVPSLRDQHLKLDEAGSRLVDAAALVGEEKLDRLAEASGNVLERGQRRACPTRLDQVDGGRSDAALAHFGEAETGFQSGLLYSSRSEVDSGQTPVPGAPM
jgi:hypothetical protein